ncbi:hypothetical protein C8J57DRAFT_1480504 [Mycena rebaudengoi]|nr:hypothetical protein C8J57DRAFT_1480504 [Mycena rebaudengoi]
MSRWCWGAQAEEPVHTHSPLLLNHNGSGEPRAIDFRASVRVHVESYMEPVSSGSEPFHHALLRLPSRSGVHLGFIYNQAARGFTLRIAEPEPEPRVVDVVADTAGPSSRALMIGPLPQNRAALWNRLLASTVRREYSGAWLGTPLAYE